MSSHSAGVEPVRGNNPPASFVFAVYADAEPDVMPRVLEQFAKRNLVPSRWYSALVDGVTPELQIDVRVDGVDDHVMGHIARCLENVVHVRQVVIARA
jgi:acetolactate synthase small subunit